MGRRRDSDRVVADVDTGLAELVPDRDRPGSWTLLLDGAPQSHVDLNDPAHLEFEYVRRLAAALDLVAPASAPLRVLHLGGGFVQTCLSDPAAWISALIPLIPYYFYKMRQYSLQESKKVL